jgi:formate-dependent nitrite reductase membrane component NrfD
MSLGTWGLLGFSGFTMLSAAAQAAGDGLTRGPLALVGRSPTGVIGALGSGFGFFVGGYTGVLLGATAVPIWARNARLLGPLFLSSALATACSAIALVVALLPGRHAGPLHRLHRAELLAGGGELLLMAAIHRHSGPLGKPLHAGRLGRLHLIGSVGLGIIFPSLVHTVGGRLGLPLRFRTILASLATLTGGFIMKYAVVMAGHASADDPAATFELAGGTATHEPTISAGTRHGGS